MKQLKYRLSFKGMYDLHEMIAKLKAEVREIDQLKEQRTADIAEIDQLQSQRTADAEKIDQLEVRRKTDIAELKVELEDQKDQRKADY